MEREHVIMNQVNRSLQTLQVTISDHTTEKGISSVVECKVLGPRFGTAKNTLPETITIKTFPYFTSSF